MVTQYESVHMGFQLDLSRVVNLNKISQIIIAKCDNTFKTEGIEIILQLCTASCR